MLNKNLRYARVENATVLHPEPTRAARFVRDTMNAVDVDQRICERIAHIPGYDDNECEHVTAGGFTFQFMKPTAAMPGSVDYYERNGNMIYTYKITVDDVDAAVDHLRANGAKVICHLTGADRLPYDHFFEGDGDPLTYAIVDCTEQCGLIFEIMNANPQLPNYTGKRKFDDIGVFQHSEIVVKDADAAAEWMFNVLGAEYVEPVIADMISRENDPEGPDLGCKHMLWGGIVWQLIFPLPHLPGWQEHLDRHGNSTMDICYHVRPDVRSVGETLRLYRAWGAVDVKIDPAEIGTYGVAPWQAQFTVDQDDPDRLYDYIWVDALRECGITWEILTMNYMWVSSTGYFFDPGVQPDPNA